MERATENLEYHGHKISIYPDDDPMNPRDGCFGTMVCFHRQYDLGDKTEWKNNFEGFNKWLAAKQHRSIVCLPLYLYDHSGITMSTSPFSCPWDSGRVGFIYVTSKTIRDEFGCKRVTDSVRKKAKEILEEEVKTYDAFISGGMFRYEVRFNGSYVEHTGNYVSVKDALEAAQEVVDRHIKESTVKLKENTNAKAISLQG